MDVPVGVGHGTQPNTINGSGQITGGYLDNNGLPQGFLYTPGVGFSFLAVPGAIASSVDGINATPIPEPGSLALVLLGGRIVGLGRVGADKRLPRLPGQKLV